MGKQESLVELHGVSKRFPGVLANDSIDLSLYPGRVHALLGENGAGKSTLVKMLYGLLAPDSGSLSWRGRDVSIDSPAKARELGIAMVFQHFSLFDSLTVLENVALGMGRDADDELEAEVIEVSHRYGLPLDPTRHVHSLSVGVRQRIEIVRCLLQNPALLIMDEPTSVLTPQEVEQLFTTLDRLASEGVAILYISHKLDEIKRLCDEVTVLRQGRKVAEANPKEESASSLATLMMGAEHLSHRGPGGYEPGAVLFEVDALNVPAHEATAITLKDISLQAHAGEILGIAGVAGNGQDELIAALSGERRSQDARSIRLKGQSVAHEGVIKRRRSGMAVVPEERLGHATVPDMSLADNTLLSARERLALTSSGWRIRSRARAYAESVIQHFNVACRGPEALSSSLSGGNLQKFIVGREILQNPDVLIVSQPTWGVDAGAAAAIHDALRSLAQAGSSVVVISQDLDELFLIADRIGALCGGELSPFYPHGDLDQRSVGILMGGGQFLDEDIAS